MIFAHSIISGYVTLQGSANVHIPMLLAMMFFVRIPSDEEIVDVFPESVVAWFYFAAAMHVILGVLNLVTWMENSPDSTHAASFKSIQLVCVLAETVNLCLMLKLYGTSVINGLKISSDARDF